MRQRARKFIKDFLVALGNCLADDISDIFGIGELLGATLGMALFAGICVGLLLLGYGFFRVAYDLMFDPNAIDVASRLAALSISPDRWV
ncbi:MAG TPA: hypothetical protein VFA85_03575 [Terriglobales bacterium]|nr:hypothetical protein [Terriglobales bacterium]